MNTNTCIRILWTRGGIPFLNDRTIFFLSWSGRQSPFLGAASQKDGETYGIPQLNGFFDGWTVLFCVSLLGPGFPLQGHPDVTRAGFSLQSLTRGWGMNEGCGIIDKTGLPCSKVSKVQGSLEARKSSANC